MWGQSVRISINLAPTKHTIQNLEHAQTNLLIGAWFETPTCIFHASQVISKIKLESSSLFSIDQETKVSRVAEPPELFQLKCLSHASGAVTHLNWNNPSVPQI
jgi:hypothetical protein